MTSIIVKGEVLAEGVRQRMIQQAALSLASKGLQRTSFSEVLEASGAPRGSLYHHFPGGKEELVLAALDLASDWALAKLEASAAGSPVEVAKAFIDLWRGVLLRSDFGSGCAVAAVAVAADAPDLLARAATIFRAWRGRLAAFLVKGGIADSPARALATLLIATCEGAVILARAERSIEPFDQATSSALALVSDAAKG